MKLITFEADGGPAIGILDGEEIIPLAADPALPAAMVDFVALGADGLERAAALQQTAARIPVRRSSSARPDPPA